jgi:hypothetical protein
MLNLAHQNSKGPESKPSGFWKSGQAQLYLSIINFEDYRELVDCTGRISRDDKRGAIDEKVLPILERLNLDPGRWCERATRFEDTYQDYRQSRRRRAA